MANTSVHIPNIGTDDAVEIIEILVSPKDQVQEGDSLIVLESDKASMEIPSPLSGQIVEIKAKVRDKVTEGTEIMTIAAVESKQSPPKNQSRNQQLRLSNQHRNLRSPPLKSRPQNPRLLRWHPLRRNLTKL